VGGYSWKQEALQKNASFQRPRAARQVLLAIGYEFPLPRLEDALRQALRKA